MKIIPISLNDFEKLHNFWQRVGLKLYPHNEEKQRLTDMLLLNPDLCFQLLEEDEILGTILGGFDGRTASIHRLAVRKDKQKQGVGRSLINELQKRLVKRGVKKLSAQIHVSNTQVIAFYRKLDFVDMDYVVTLYKDL